MNFIDKPLAFVDVETTGGSPTGDRVIEIGVLRVEDGKIVKTMDTLVNPLAHIPPMITSMTGIHQTDVARAPLFDELSSELNEILRGAIFIAHNARFDYGFIKNEFMRQGRSFNAKTLCTVRLTRKVFPGLTSYSLGNLINQFELQIAARHRAYDDAYAMYQLVERAIEAQGLEVVRTHVKELLRGPAIPKNLPKRKIKNLPETPGVYKFLSDEATLYIGKSVNLKRRVMNHFHSDYKVSTDRKILRYASDVEVRPTAGEIGALIRESQMIKDEQPIYNRVLRRRSELVVLFKEENKYYQGNLKRVQGVEPQDVERVLGVFKSLKSAKEELYALCGEHKLCPFLMGLEKSKPCFNYKLGKCLGACMSAENTNKYNLRFLEAFSEKKIREWPFDGAVGIVEQGNGLIEQHVVDRWCYVGSVEVNGSGEPKKSLYKPRYDHDIYKIFSRKLFSNNQKDIKILSQEELDELFA